MNWRRRFFSCLGVITVALAVTGTTASAIVYTSAVSGDWQTPATWGAAAFPIAGDNVTIAVGHAITLSANAACATLTINGGATGGTLTLSLGWNLTVSGGITTNSGAVNGTLADDATASTINCGGNWTNSGTFTAGIGTVIFNGTSTITSGGVGAGKLFNNVTLNGTSATLSTNPIDINGNFTITAGTWGVGALNMNVAGNWTNSGTFTAGTGTVTFDGTSTINSGGVGAGKLFNNVTLNGTSATLATNSIDIDGNFTITAGTWGAGALNMNVAGNWTNSGTFTAGTGAVTFDGAGTLNSGGITQTFNNVQVSAGTRTVITNSVKITGKLTINSGAVFGINTGGLNLYTGEGGAIDVDIDGTLNLQLTSASGNIYWYVLQGSLVDLDVNGTLTFDGYDATNRVYLRSSVDGTQWQLKDNTASASNPFVNYADVKDSDASPGNWIVVADNTTVNSGNNVKWSFTPPVPFYPSIAFVIFAGLIVLTTVIYLRRKRALA